jgi:hypothetical protein
MACSCFIMLPSIRSQPLVFTSSDNMCTRLPLAAAHPQVCMPCLMIAFGVAQGGREPVQLPAGVPGRPGQQVRSGGEASCAATCGKRCVVPVLTHTSALHEAHNPPPSTCTHPLTLPTAHACTTLQHQPSVHLPLHQHLFTHLNPPPFLSPSLYHPSPTPHNKITPTQPACARLPAHCAEGQARGGPAQGLL